MSDLCYPFPVFQRVLARAELMDRMLGRCGIDPGVAVRLDGGAAWYEARTRCIDCPSGHNCAHWLMRSEGEPQGAVPTFCPNRDFFDRCAHASRGRAAPAPDDAG
jgi:hypothetical protein